MDRDSPDPKFLPIGELHAAVHVSALLPCAIKDAAREAREAVPESARNRLKHTTTLNHIAKGLGVAPGFAEYESTYSAKLLPFMQKYRLEEQRNLLATAADRLVRLAYRQIADRMFVPGLPQPKRIFTGTGVDYWTLLMAAAGRTDMKVCALGDEKTTTPYDQTRITEINTETPPFRYFVRTRSGVLELSNTPQFSNLIGDQLCDCGTEPTDARLIATLYQVDASKAAQTKGSLRIFRELIAGLDSGWMTVIPFSQNLVFLTDGQGGYDFVFRNLRDMHHDPAPASKSRPDSMTIARSVDERFEAWLYFHYTGWEERDQHDAELAFYEAGGTLATYPGLSTIFREYLDRQGRGASAASPCEFCGSRADKGTRKLTPLVTIKEFRRFLCANPDYRAHRRNPADGDPWYEANTDSNDKLPASVTWYDAKAYAEWVNQDPHREVRLPTESEYREFFRDYIPSHISVEDVVAAHARRLCDFIGPDGTVYAEHPPYMPNERFAELRIRYRLPLPLRHGPDGTKLVQSPYFGEWLEAEGAAINGLFFCAQGMTGAAHETVVSPLAARFASGSTGKYKSMKIGFRLALFD